MNKDHILLAHGSGGSMMQELIQNVFFDGYGSKTLHDAEDAGVITSPSGQKLAMSTDSYVVTPHFFPGGNIGKVAACGTINDVATSGAQVLALSCAFILEENYPVEHLKKIIDSMDEVSKETGVEIITGDTKVVDKGHGDGVFITTTGIGEVDKNLSLSVSNAKPGDKILLSGSIGDHGICIMTQRENLGLYTDIKSDCAPLNTLIYNVLQAAPNTRCFRDPTRGGLASTLNEISDASNVDILIEEARVPIKEQVKRACEMLGFDVFQVANEGKMVAIVPANEADDALKAMQSSPYGKDSKIIGEVLEPKYKDQFYVYLQTTIGSRRILDILVGEQLPRIC